MQGLGALLLLGGMIAIIAGCVMFLPLARWRPHRRRAKFIALGGLAAFIGGMIVMPTPPADGSKPVVASVAEKSEPAVAVKAEPKVDDRADERAGLLSNYRKMLALAKDCDPAIAAIAEAASSGSMVAVYSAAKDGQDGCQGAWMGITQLSAESGDKEEEAIETCGNAYYLRQRAMETAMTIADGDAKPSNVVSFQDDLKAGQAGVMLCVAQFFVAAGELGIKPDQMSAISKS